MFNPRDYLAKKYVEEKEREKAIRDRGFVSQHQADEAWRREIFDPIKGAAYLYDAANLIASPIAKYFTGQSNQGVLSKAREMQAALRENEASSDGPDPINSERPAPINNGLMSANPISIEEFTDTENQRPQYTGDGSDLRQAQDRSINDALAGEQNINNSVDVPSDPSDPRDKMTSRSLLRRALEASRTPIDMQRFEQLAQDRQRAGDLSMITSLAAGEAGPRYSGYQESYLKKALGEQGDKQLGDYGFASGGEFYETPGIQQARGQEADFAAAELLFDAENDRLAREQAERRLELSERRYDLNYLTPGERQNNARELGKLDELARTAYQTLRAIPTMEEAQGEFYQGIFADAVNEINRLMSLTGDEAAGQRVAAFNVAEGLANQFGIAKLSDIGGNDTERELMIAISTTFGRTNRPEANRILLKLLKDTAIWNAERAEAAKIWSWNYGTIHSPNEDGQTFGQYYETQKPANKDRDKYLSGSEGGSAGEVPPGAVLRLD